MATKMQPHRWELVKDKDPIPDGVYHFAGEGAQEVLIEVAWTVYLISVGGKFYNLVRTKDLATASAKEAWAELQCQE